MPPSPKHIKDFRDFPDRAVGNMFVYGLLHPLTGELRYIGKTVSGMSRPQHHATESAIIRGKNKHKINWTKLLLRQGLKPLIVILKECETESELSETEVDRIRFFRSQGFRLLNQTAGGEGFRHSEATKRKLSLLKMGHVVTEATKNKMSEAGKGRVFSEATRAKIRAANLGIPKSEEAKRHMSEAKKGRTYQRRPTSEATKQKMSESLKAYWATCKPNRKE